jgi:bone morphogenetic protein 2/4
MRAWLFVFAVLATSFNGQHVASTEEVKQSSSSNLITSSSTDSSSSIDSSSNRDNNKNSYSNELDISDSVESEKYYRGDKPDPQTLVQIEKNLLSLFGFEKRPKVDRSKIVIPEAMKKLYAQITGHELEIIDAPKADIHSKDANTIRSYTHEGELRVFV